MADGWITVGTKLSTDKFDKQIADLEKKIKKEEEKAQIKLEAKLEAENELQKHKESIREVEQEYEKTSKQIEYIQGLLAKKTSGTYLTPKEVADVSSYDQVKEKNEEIGNQLDGMYDKQGKLKRKVDQTANAYNDVKDNVVGYKTKIESIKLQKHQAQINSIKDGIKKINSNVGNSIKSIGRMALGVLSVASAYRLLSSASSTLAQYDKQYATNLEYIRYLLAQVLAPVLQFIVNMAGTLLSYLNYIVQAWFKIPLFAKDAAKSFEKARNSTSKIKKDLQTTSFDEMNILSDTSSTAGGGTVAPSIDPTQIAGEVPEWLKWIADNKDIILGVLMGIAGALGLIKLGDLIEGLSKLGGLLEPIKLFLEAHGKTLAGILSIIGGIATIVDGVIKYLKDPSWENFIEIMAGIALVVGGVALLFGGIPALITGIILVIAALGLAIYKHWSEIKETLGKVGSWINEHIIQPIGQFFSDLWKKITDGVKNAVQGIKNIFSTVVDFFKNLISKIVNAFKSLGEKAGEVISSAFKAVVNGVLKTIETVLNAPIRAINGLIDVINNVPGINLGRLSTFNLPRLKSGGIINAPGRGIPVGGGLAVGGEAGREGVIPLTDSQAMESLGEAIGRYITINANIINKMNGRVISREIQQVQNNEDFAYNG